MISERQEYKVFRELLRAVPGLEARLMESSEEEVIAIADLVSRSVNCIVLPGLTRLNSRFKKVPMAPGQTIQKA